jgi:hypothetical protein
MERVARRRFTSEVREMLPGLGAGTRIFDCKTSNAGAAVD